MKSAGSHDVSVSTHFERPNRTSGHEEKACLSRRKEGEDDGRRAFKRPAPAVWGNGLWGSVGGAGRSYD